MFGIFSDDLLRGIAASAIVIIALAWTGWTFLGKSKTRQPPLPPGPRGLPVVGSLPFLDPELHTYFAQLSKTYGPILSLRLGNKLGVVVTSPSTAREVLKDHDVIFANRDVPVAGVEATYGGRDIVWTPYGAEWRMLRRVCVQQMLSNVTLDSIYGPRRREVRQTVKYLYSRAGSPVDVGEQAFVTTLNVITTMMWGGTVEGDERERMGAEFRRLVAAMVALLGKPNLSDFFPGLARFDLQGIRKEMRGLAEAFDKMWDGLIDQRLKMDVKDGGTQGESKDFLQFLLKLKDEEGDTKTPLTMNHLKALLTDMVVGGSDTTSNSVELTISEMMRKPEVLRKVQQELETVVGKNNVVEESHISRLPYLYAVMKEVLRLHPVLPLLVPHCPSESCTIGGYTVPKGSRIFVNVWAIHRDSSVWENPLEFDPDRFLNSQFDFRGNDFSYFPFGSGRRICAGTAMAERMFMYLVASLVHSFDWELPKGEKLDLSVKFGIVMKKKMSLVAIPVPRLSDPSLYE